MGTVSNKPAKKTVLCSQFSEKNPPIYFIKMNILCFTICCTLFASVTNAANSGRQLVAPKDNRIEDIDNEVEDEGIIDSIFGDGAQSRIVERMSDWLVDRASENPGCVERFVCETYRTGETLNGVPYMMMTLTNAAVSFMVADMFDKSIDIKELTRAARYGRTVGSCHTMKCDFLDNQLRTVGDYLGTFEEFLSQVFNSISESLSFGK